MIELIAFLGNPGLEYAHNRHNAGWLLGEKLPFAASLGWQKKYKGSYASLETSRLLANQGDPGVPELPQKLHFLMPGTFMNLSGDSVFAAASFFKIKPERILVVHDELEIPLGTASFKFSGGLGGHNGLRSMKANFGTADFWRLRIGIGRPNHDDIAGWVLSDFTRAEEPILEPVLDAAAGALVTALLQGPESLLPGWNKKRIGTQSA